MPFLPQISESRTRREFTDTFLGYDHRLKIGHGEYFDTENLTNDFYPLLSTRKKRGTVTALTSGQSMIEKDALAYIDNGVLYYNGNATGLTGISEGDKQLVGMGAYICIFPDKLYFNTQDDTDFGSMETHYANAPEGSTAAVTYQACKSDGTLYEQRTVSTTEPEDPSNGDIWVDSTTGTFYEWSSVQITWVEILTVFTKITFSTMGQLDVRDYDGVSIAGCPLEDLNGEKIVYAHGGSETEHDYVVVVGLLQSDLPDVQGRVTIDRNVPSMDFVCEAQNRLWGCFYGNDGTQNLNEICCCALGDFRNWRQYLGISTDSWTASVGSDGVWTGAVNYLGYPTFFKENCIHRVVISPEGAHQIIETECRGVQAGSHRSLQIVGETLFYKSRTDVCAWQGGFPTGISEALGDVKYYDAVAGTFGSKYYISMKDADNHWHLFVYDSAKSLWIREDSLHAKCFAAVDDELYCIDTEDRLLALNGTIGDLEETLTWKAESGLQYYQYPDSKYVSRCNFRLKCSGTIKLYMEYDSSGEWIESGSIASTGTDTVTIPVKPRRCDHLRYKLEGTGDVKLYSIARVYEIGSDY
ncbi:MAG: hypothetical protein IJH53_06160 [Oscillospiraceae bacterium]|nr:hypothetical protein [Oscillospiraceae bacterium]